MVRARPTFAWTLLAMLLLVGLALAAPCLAHQDGAHPTFGDVPEAIDQSDVRTESDTARIPSLSASPAPAPVPWPLLLAVLGVAALCRTRPRQAVAFGLVLLLALFAFEDGLHSTHHGVDARATASCPVATASAHMSATTANGAPPSDIVLAALAAPADPAVPQTVQRVLCPDQGRAPPASRLI